MYTRKFDCPECEGKGEIPSASGNGGREVCRLCAGGKEFHLTHMEQTFEQGSWVGGGNMRKVVITATAMSPAIPENVFRAGQAMSNIRAEPPPTSKGQYKAALARLEKMAASRGVSVTADDTDDEQEISEKKELIRRDNAEWDF